MYVNGLPVGSTDNMFSRYSFEVREQLQTGENELRLEFASPVEYAAERFAEQLANYIVPPECVDPQFQGECHANHIRKMQASFRLAEKRSEMDWIEKRSSFCSWDWGPAFPDMGIWQDIALEGYNTAILRSFNWVTEEDKANEQWLCTVTVFVENGHGGSAGDIDTGVVDIRLGSIIDREDDVALEQIEGEKTGGHLENGFNDGLRYFFQTSQICRREPFRFMFPSTVWSDGGRTDWETRPCTRSKCPSGTPTTWTTLP